MNSTFAGETAEYKSYKIREILARTKPPKTKKSMKHKKPRKP